METQNEKLMEFKINVKELATKERYESVERLIKDVYKRRS